MKNRPVALIVRDGWGSNPHPEWNDANAVHLARKPVDERLMAAFPHVLIKTSGNAVGLPAGVMGNSEVGHQNIGAGRVVEQEIMRITGRIKDGSFFDNPVLVGALERAASNGGRVHMMGLCSDGRVHSDLDHLFGLLELTKRRGFPGSRVFVHAFTDGRDTAPMRGVDFVRRIDDKCHTLGINPIASVVGRFYAMDRDNRWGRVEQAYRLLAFGEGVRCPNAAAAAEHYYANPSEPSRKGDEFIIPSVTVGDGREPATIRDGDSVIFFNFRGDRPRELCKAFVLDEFPYEQTSKDGAITRFGFDRGKKLDIGFVGMTRYEQNLPIDVAFEKPAKLVNILGEFIAKQGMRQFRCAETEKYPHVTFFFNDYRDGTFEGEEQLLIPSPRDISTYDQKPQMSALEVTDAVVTRVEQDIDDLLIINFANGDMVGHTGDLQAAICAVETVDECVGRVVNVVLERGGGLIVTADHGNCEQMIDPKTGGPHTAHTTYDVECLVVDERFKNRTLRTGGCLADLAPTVLQMLDLPKPEEMTGRSLLDV